MTLLEEIQSAAVDQNSQLGTILRKCKLLGARLRSQPLENWLIHESNGYPPEIDVPDYRVWALQVKGHFAGSLGSMVRNAPIPLINIPERVRNSYKHFQCRQSIATLETLLEESKAGVVTWTAPTGDLAVLLEQTCTSTITVLQLGQNLVLDP